MSVSKKDNVFLFLMVVEKVLIQELSTNKIIRFHSTEGGSKNGSQYRREYSLATYS
jgi:hypothetical protein